MDIEKLKAELEDAYKSRESRAAFGSILRRNIVTMANMTSAERAQFLSELSLPVSYMTEIAKEVAVWKYDKRQN